MAAFAVICRDFGLTLWSWHWQIFRIAGYLTDTEADAIVRTASNKNMKNGATFASTQRGAASRESQAISEPYCEFLLKWPLFQ